MPELAVSDVWADVYHLKAIQGMQKLYDETVKHLPAPKSFQEDQIGSFARY